MSTPKIAVYTIALNEEKHVRRWVESAKEADLLVIADTGSTDKTRILAKSLGVAVTQIEVKPWRFDVARNASLALIPEDYDVCISLDMDEVLPTHWRSVIEEAYSLENYWPVYKTVNSRDLFGAPRYFWHGFKIHPRKGFQWKYPIHEVLVPDPNIKCDRKEIDLEIDHLKDQSKSRGSYLGLLELAVQEDPGDWRMSHYLNREHFYLHDWVKVLQTAYHCKQLPGGWDVERSSTYMWASEASNVLKFSELAEEWAERATLAAPNFYEAWHWRAHIAHLNAKWADCLEFAKKRLTLERQYHHLVKPDVWEWWGYDLIALSNYKLGNMKEASLYGKLALDGSPNDERLKKNLTYYQAEG
jgi:glycosyltransferase involved in cell wall biosynthesis